MRKDRIHIEFDRLFDLVFEIDRNAVDVNLSVEAGAEEEITISSGTRWISIRGRSKNEVLCGIYTFFEDCGMQFLITGEMFLKYEKLREIPEIHRKLSAGIKNRGIRMHLNFVQDQSFFSEEDFKGFIAAMSRMKMNYLLFHMYNGQEWFPFSYRGHQHLDLELGNLGRKILPEHMIGREKIRTQNIWYPRELEEITDTKELLIQVHARYLRMMEYAKEFGIRLAASFEPEVISETFEQKMQEWSQEEGKDKKYNLTTDWQEGWSGKKIADISTINPILLDMAVERALSLYRAYPLLDELHLISREGTSFQAETVEEYLQELKRLEESLGISFADSYVEELKSVNEDDSRINPKSYPYWTVLPGDDYMSSVIGAFRYLEFARKILSDERMVGLQQETGVQFVISLYSPNPKTMKLVCQYAGRVLPQGVRFDILGDYGARDICRQMDSWKPIQEAGKELGMISWLEFDGNMALAQGWTRSIYDNVAKAAQMNIQTVYFNHWRLHSLEQNAEIAAKACFDPAQTYDYYMKRYAGNLFGSENQYAGIMAYEILEEATAFCKSNLYNIGFTNDWVYQHSTDSPGYRWKDLEHSSHLFELAEYYFKEASRDSNQPGAAHGTYMADMCRISRYHLQAVQHLQKSKLPLMGYQCFPLSQDGNWPDGEQLKDYVHEAWMALQYEYAYMKRYAKWVSGSDEQGQLAHHQLGTIEPLEYHYQTLKKQYDKSISSMIGEDGDDQDL